MSFDAKIRSDFIDGIAKVNGKFMILLNVNRVLSTKEIGQMGQMAGTVERSGGEVARRTLRLQRESDMASLKHF